jgi:hypothetical protein
LILVDTSIWADHYRAPHAALIPLIARRGVVMHRLVIEELAMGPLPERGRTLDMMMCLPRLAMLEMADLLSFVEQEGLIGSGLGPNDVHLLASALAGAAQLWTRDKRLRAHAERLGCGWANAPSA